MERRRRLAAAIKGPATRWRNVQEPDGWVGPAVTLGPNAWGKCMPKELETSFHFLSCFFLTKILEVWFMINFIKQRLLSNVALLSFHSFVCPYMVEAFCNTHCAAPVSGMIQKKQMSQVSFQR